MLYIPILFWEIHIIPLSIAMDFMRGKCDQIGRFLMFLATNFLTRVAQIFDDSLGYFETCNFLI